MCTSLITQPASISTLKSGESLFFYFFYKVISDLSLCRFAVFGHPRLQCVGFAPQCGKHLLKGFQVQFGFGWTSQLISLPPLWHGITTIQEQNFPRTTKKKEKIVVHKVEGTLPDVLLPHNKSPSCHKC